MPGPATEVTHMRRTNAQQGRPMSRCLRAIHCRQASREGKGRLTTTGGDRAPSAQIISQSPWLQHPEVVGAFYLTILSIPAQSQHPGAPMPLVSWGHTATKGPSAACWPGPHLKKHLIQRAHQPSGQCWPSVPRPLLGVPWAGCWLGPQQQP